MHLPPNAIEPTMYLRPNPSQRRSRQSPPLLRHAFAQEHGAALVEFALVLPLLLALVFGITQFGLAINSANDETHLANEVARYAAVNEDPGEPNNETLQAWAKKQGDQNALKSGASVCISFPSGTEPGRPVEVVMTSKVSWLPLISGLELGKLTGTTIEGKAYMRLETAPTHYAAGCA
jgi:hypothetical protein